MKKTLVAVAVMLMTIVVCHAKSVDDFKGAVGDNYEGFISEPVMIETCSEFDEHLIREVCASVERAGVTYYRCGPLVKGLGTRVSREQFILLWWGKFGGKMLTIDELSAIPNPDIDELVETD